MSAVVGGIVGGASGIPIGIPIGVVSGFVSCAVVYAIITFNPKDAVTAGKAGLLFGGVGGLTGGLNGGLSGGLNEDCFALLKLIQTGKYPRITHLMKELESSRRTLERQLADLKDQGLISYEGSKKSGAYVLSSEGVLGLEELKSRIKLQ